jgi:uncharacterized protein YndB with AHSA1/START domain
VEKKLSGPATISLPSDTEILIERKFSARKALVFDAWCKRDWIAQWYGCADQQLTTCDTDFREGGEWRWVLRDASGGFEHAFSGRYRLIERPNRLVFSERYEAIPGSDHTVALTFEEREGVTTLAMRITHETKENRDGHLKSGMETGLQESFNRIEQLASAAGAKL